MQIRQTIFIRMRSIRAKNEWMVLLGFCGTTKEEYYLHVLCIWHFFSSVLHLACWKLVLFMFNEHWTLMKWSWYGTQAALLFCNNIVAESCRLFFLLRFRSRCFSHSFTRTRPHLHAMAGEEWIAQKRKILMELWMYILFRWGIFSGCVSESSSIHVRWECGTYIFHLLKYTQEIPNETL